MNDSWSGQQHGLSGAGGGIGGSFISKVLLANADALCAAASPLVEQESITLWVLSFYSLSLCLPLLFLSPVSPLNIFLSVRPPIRRPTCPPAFPPRPPACLSLYHVFQWLVKRCCCNFLSAVKKLTKCIYLFSQGSSSELTFLALTMVIMIKMKYTTCMFIFSALPL